LTSLGGKKWYSGPRVHKDRHYQEERLPTGAGEEGVATEKQTTCDGSVCGYTLIELGWEVEE